jgi:hypothetical protein
MPNAKHPLRSLRPLLMAVAVIAWEPLLQGQEATPPPPPAEPPPGETVTPASDREETGALTDLLPDRVEPLTLPHEETEAAQNEVSLFPDELWPPPPDLLPDGGEEEQAPAVLAASPSEPLPPEIAASCFGPGPPPALHDPQHLLTPAQAAPLLALLQHSLNSRGSFQTSIVVLKPSQQIPVALNPPELLQRWYGGGKGLLVLYFLGQPDRTQAFFSPESRQYHRSEDLRMVIDFSVREAARMPAPVSQLQRFCYKVAIRLDRLHRQGVVSPSDEAPIVAASVPSTSLWWAFAIGVQAAVLGAGAVWWWRRRLSSAGRKGAAVYFPDQELVSRLSGPHSGGNGAVIQFGVTGHRL